VIQEFEPDRRGVRRNTFPILLLIDLAAYASYSVEFLDCPDQPSGHHLCGASGSIPRSIFAMRSWCFMSIAAMAIAPPTMIATTGTRYGPNLEISSIAKTRRTSCVFRRSQLYRNTMSFANDVRRTTNGGFSGGADRDRTGGLLVANQALSQLSYSPTASFKVSRFKASKGL
jgi:hypothetical protein